MVILSFSIQIVIMIQVAHQLEALRLFFRSGETRSLEFRKHQLGQLKNAILKYETDLTQALYEDLHKSPEEVWITETGMVLAEINHVIKHLESWMTPVKVGTPIINQPGKSYIQKEPLGVVLIIAPWNYPFQLLFMPLIGAIAAGNGVVLKPSELAPATEKIMQQIIAEAFPTNYIAFFPGPGASILPEMMNSFQFDHIFYTGSTQVGRIIYQQAAAQLIPVTLELGGKSPCIVTKSAHLKVAARRIVNARFSNAGQMCITPDYLLVDQSIKSTFMELLRATIQKFYGDQPIASYDYGRIINQKQFQRLRHLMAGETIYYGGEHNEEALYIAPTLIDQPALDAPIMQEEIFGPLMPVLGYSSQEEARNIIDLHPNPLAFYIFSQDKKEVDHWLEQLPFGGGCVNAVAMQYLNKKLPFGGRGHSGLGKYHGQFSFDCFSHTKAILKASTWPDLPMAYPTMKGKLATLKKLIK